MRVTVRPRYISKLTTASLSIPISSLKSVFCFLLKLSYIRVRDSIRDLMKPSRLLSQTEAQDSVTDTPIVQRFKREMVNRGRRTMM